MLDIFIIEEIKRREREREIQRESERPHKELPLPSIDEQFPRPQEEEENERGVVIVDYSIDDHLISDYSMSSALLPKP